MEKTVREKDFFEEFERVFGKVPAYFMAAAVFRTAPEVPKLYAHWRRKGNETTCSHCGFIYYSNKDDFNYCPNCGAIMHGEEKKDG